ncbi:MAG: hypothetical protein AB7G13_25520 [Lautropia sp.]
MTHVAVPVPDPLAPGKALGDRELVLERQEARRHLEAIGAADNGLYSGLYSAEPGRSRALWPAAGLFYEPMEFQGPRAHEKGRAAFNAGIQWLLHGALHVGDRLRLSARISDRWLKRGREYAVIEMTARNQAGKLVAVGCFKESWDRPPEYLPPLPSLDGQKSSWRVEPKGIEVNRFDCRYTDAMSRLFAGPIRNLHTELDMARQRGFDRLVIAGPQIVAQMSELMTRTFGLDYLASGEIKVNLLKPVFSGDTVSARAAFIDSDGESAGGERTDPVQVAIWAVNQHAETVAAGVGQARIRRDSSGRPDEPQRS